MKNINQDFDDTLLHIWENTTNIIDFNIIEHINEIIFLNLSIMTNISIHEKL